MVVVDPSQQSKVGACGLADPVGADGRPSKQQARRRVGGAGPSLGRGGVGSTHPRNSNSFTLPPARKQVVSRRNKSVLAGFLFGDKLAPV